MTNSLNRKELRWGAAYALFQFFLLPLLIPPVAHFLHLPGWGANVAMFAINFICTLVIYHRFLWEELPIVRKSLRKVLSFVPLGIGMYYIGTMLISSLNLLLCPQFRNLNDANISTMVEQSRLFMVIGTVILVPTAEEMLFRGLLFRGIYDRSAPLAWVLSAGLFSAVHVVGYIGRYTPLMLVLAFLQYLPAGIVLAFLYKKTGTIATPILTHTFINLIGISMM